MKRIKNAIDVEWIGRSGLHRLGREDGDPSPTQSIDTPETEDETPQLYVVRDGQTHAIFKRQRMGFIR